MPKVKILALSGSLRAASFNTAAIKALSILVPDSVEMSIFGLGDIPLFNPDREGEIIDPVIRLKALLKQSDGLIIASPEYAHGVTGVLKNALDWLVSGDEFVDKPIMLVNTSPRASHAQASLKEILKTMSGNIIEDAQVEIPLLGSQLDTSGIVKDADIAGQLVSKLGVFVSTLVVSK